MSLNCNSKNYIWEKSSKKEKIPIPNEEPIFKIDLMKKEFLWKNRKKFYFFKNRILYFNVILYFFYFFFLVKIYFFKEKNVRNKRFF